MSAKDGEVGLVAELVPDADSGGSIVVVDNTPYRILMITAEEADAMRDFHRFREIYPKAIFEAAATHKAARIRLTCEPFDMAVLNRRIWTVQQALAQLED